MIMNMVGGCGASLNFKIVGGTVQPENPKRNTIWLNTDVEITGWDISAAAPETAVEGMVWIGVGTSGDIAFNALKKNAIQIFPLSAKQYVSGEWVNVKAQIYQGGEWTELWNGVLFENADQYEDITGGWVKGASYGNVGTTATIDDTGIKLSTVSGSFINVETVNKIDISGHSTLYVDATVTSRTSSSANYLWLAYTESSGQAIHDSAAVPKASAKVTALGNVTLSLDVSTADGEYFVVFGASVGGMGVTVNKIWLE